LACAILCDTRTLRNFNPNRCHHLVRRIANRAFFMTDDGRAHFVERMWRVAGGSCGSKGLAL